MRHLEGHRHERAGLLGEGRFRHQDLMIAVGEPLNDFSRRLLAREIEEELLDVLNLQRALLESVLLDQVFNGHPKIIRH